MSIFVFLIGFFCILVVSLIKKYITWFYRKRAVSIIHDKNTNNFQNGTHESYWFVYEKTSYEKQFFNPFAWAFNQYFPELKDK